MAKNNGEKIMAKMVKTAKNVRHFGHDGEKIDGKNGEIVKNGENGENGENRWRKWQQKISPWQNRVESCKNKIKNKWRMAMSPNVVFRLTKLSQYIKGLNIWGLQTGVSTSWG